MSSGPNKNIRWNEEFFDKLFNNYETKFDLFVSKVYIYVDQPSCKNILKDLLPNYKIKKLIIFLCENRNPIKII